MLDCKLLQPQSSFYFPSPRWSTEPREQAKRLQFSLSIPSLGHHSSFLGSSPTTSQCQQEVVTETIAWPLPFIINWGGGGMLGLKPRKMANRDAYLTHQSGSSCQFLPAALSPYLYRVWLAYPAPTLNFSTGLDCPFPRQQAAV